MKWSQEEIDELVYTVEAGWAIAFPGWDWVSMRLWREGFNKRTANACKQKYLSIQGD